MRRWEHHRTRSKVVLLLLINLVTLLGGRYTALITIVKFELFGDAVAFAKPSKKKPAKSHLSRDPHNPSLAQPAGRPLTKPEQPRRGARLPTHVVRHGETLSQIAHLYGVSIASLRAINRLKDPDHLLKGQKLRIPPQDVSVAAELEPKTSTKERPPQVGERWRLERHIEGGMQGRRSFIWPVEGTLTSPFGERDHVMGGSGTQFHAGIDLAVSMRTPVRAAQEGIVVFAGYNGSYGKVVKLDHLNGYSTLYAHNSRLLVHVGQRVKVGQIICLSGNTGRSTGPHLHFEVHKDGWPVDPLPHLQ